MSRDVRLDVVGCGDAFGSGGRFQTCFLLRDDHGVLAVDFGATSLVAMRANGQNPQDITHIILTHYHGDHMGGLPFFLLDREYSARRHEPLCIAGPPGLAERLKTVMECLFPGGWRDEWSFALELIEIEPGQPVEIAGRWIRSAKVVHPTGPFEATAIRVETCGKVVGFSGDTGWTDALIDVADGSDLFVCECFDFAEQPYGGHISLPVLLAKLPEIKTRRILLNHLGPDMIDNLATIPLETLEDGASYVI